MKRLAVVLVLVLALPGSAAAAHQAPHVPGCHTGRCDIRIRRACWSSNSCRTRVVRKQWHKVADPYWGVFNAIASCESHGNWRIATGNGFYGGIQFTLRTWQGVGGSGYPHRASKLEQIYRGVLTMRAQGWNAWPVCRRAAGV